MSAPASRDPVQQLAAHLVALARSGQARVIGGTVAALIDDTHVLVDLGDQAITAAWPASLGTPEDELSVRVLVSGGTAEVISTKATPPTPEVPDQAVYAWASGSASLSFSSSGTASVSVSFPSGRFTVSPRWLAWIRTADMRVIISATNESTSGGTIRGAVVGTMTGSVSVGWAAWQRTSTSKD